MYSKNAIVIGSGVAGLASATRLAVLGFKVTVFEANDRPGGKLTMFEKDGYRFDAGPSLFTQPANIEELFALANEPITDYFSYKPVDIACKYFFENEKLINAFTNKELFAQEMQEKTGDKREVVLQYLQRSEKLYNNIGEIFLNFSLHKSATWLNRRIIKALGSLKLPYLFSNLNKYNKHQFKSAEAVQLFNRYATYNGSNPYKAPGMLSVIPHLEYNQGVFYPKGGMINITNALYKLAIKKGVEFRFNTAVKNIIHHEGKVTGVVVNEENRYASVIVSNADIYFTYKNLLNSPLKAKKVLKQERSSSALIFYWGIKHTFPELELHNIFFSENYQAEFDGIFNKGSFYKDPTVYVNITSKMEDGHAPEGKENWFVMINAPANAGQDWEQFKSDARLRIVDKLSRLLKTDIAALIETEEILDPVMIENKTGSYMGSLYGTSSNSKLAAFFRHPNFTGYIKGLYFCGGSVHPGGGIPLCFKSAMIATTLISKDFKNTDH